ncbi:alpha/beta hydrolase [Chryseobacterium sp. GP-SGM7]|uniref:alpha/beta hydrolase n=1 Tax=Chryseobacterium sp. GP-SGM7 TaxID=3411323 RepID=UPI003B956C2B
MSLLLTSVTLMILSFKMITTENKPSLHYLVKQPKIKTARTPLVILMHGVGSNEQNMFSFADALPDNFLVVSARGPLTLRPNSYAWFQAQIMPDRSIINEEQAENSRKEIIQFIEDLKNVEDFDEEQVYLMGFSQGGIMSYSVALTEPEKIKGIAVMSGRLLSEVKPLIVSDERLKKLNIFISHGTHDSVLKFGYATDAVDYLHSKGLQPEFHQYPEDHTINQQMLGDVVKWLYSQSK